MRKFIIGSLTLLLTTGCTNLFYYPDSGIYQSPTAFNYQYEYVNSIDAESPTLRGWLIHAKISEGKEPKGTVMHLHGNAQNISAYLGSVRWFVDAGYDVLMIDYRGYGPSDGEAEIHGMHADLFRLFSFAEKRGRPIVLFGQSLGGAMALWLASQNDMQTKIQAIVVEGPFTSYRSIARSRLAQWWLSYPLQWPLGFLISNQYSPSGAISKLTKESLALFPPVLLLHDNDDPIVPFGESSKLLELLPGKTTEVVTSGVRHIFHSSADESKEAIQSFLDRNAQ